MAFQGSPRQPRQTIVDQGGARRSKAEQGRHKADHETKADQGIPWQTMADDGDDGDDAVDADDADESG